MEQLVLLLIIGAISLINWLIQKSAEYRQKRAEERLRAERAAAGHVEHDLPEPEQDDLHQEREAEERTRKFLEALGLPEDAMPPRPAERTPPPLPQASAPAEVFRAPEPTRPRPKKNFLHKIRPELERDLAAADVSKSEIVDPFAVDHRFPRKRLAGDPRPVSSGQSLMADLQTRKNGLREAIVLREILGPPKALEPRGLF